MTRLMAPADEIERILAPSTILLDADPLIDIRNTRRIAAVVVPRQGDLDRLLAAHRRWGPALFRRGKIAGSRTNHDARATDAHRDTPPLPIPVNTARLVCQGILTREFLTDVAIDGCKFLGVL